MKNNRNLLTWSLTTIIFLNSCNDVDRKQDERQIRELWTKACKYVCNGDWENYSECWDHSTKIQIIHSDQGEWLTGWDKIGEKYEAMLNSGMKCSFPKNDLILNISEAGDMAWGTADMILQFNDSAKSQTRLWETGVFEKINGEWKMVLGMASVPRNIEE